MSYCWTSVEGEHCTGQQRLRRTSRRAERDELGRQTHQGQLKPRTEGIDNLIDQPDRDLAHSHRSDVDSAPLRF